jgi:Flp pilus assembly protein TadG
MRRLWQRDEHGSELIELAIVLPILLFIVAGIMDFGFLFQRWEVVTNAAREGARMAVLSAAYTDADIQQRVGDYLDASGLDSSVATITGPTAGSDTLPSGLTVNTRTVTVEYPSQFLFMGPFAWMVGGSGFTAITLRAASTMRVESGGS